MVEVNREVAFDLDSTLDDIADLASFGAWPTGAYTVELQQAEKEIESLGKCIEVKFLHLVSNEIPEKKATDVEPKPGDESSQLVSLKNNVALGAWKKAIMKPLAEKFGATLSTRQLIAASNGCKCLVVLAKTEKNGKEYQQVKLLTVL